MTNPPDRQHIVLAGAGHAHLHTIKRLDTFLDHGVDVTVISPGRFWYSGLATGMLGGLYPPELDQVDIGEMVHAAGGSFINGELQSIDHTAHAITLYDGTCLPFDILSINVGSACRSIPGENERCYSVKPIEELARLRHDLELVFANPKAAPAVISVAGGGVTAFEIAGNIRALADRHGSPCNITILCGSPQPLLELPDGAAHRVMSNFISRDIHIETGSRVRKIHEHHAELVDGRRFRFDYFVNATGLIPNTFRMDLELALDASGGICIDKTLRASGHTNIFAVGDCASLEGHTLPKIGVYAIRQAPVLFDNIVAQLDRTPTRQFTPQRQFLSIVTLGDGNALATRGSRWWFGRLAFLLKDWIDRRFLRSIRSRRSARKGRTRYGKSDSRRHRGLWHL